MLALIEKIFSPKVLFVLNVALVLLIEFVGGGVYFAKTGLIHAIALIFVALIIVRIFSEYAFSDYILKGFLKIQLGFFLFLGLVHIYEYLALYVFSLDREAVELSAMICYFIWILGVLIATEFIFRIYQKKSGALTSFFVVLIVAGAMLMVAMNINGKIAEDLEKWIPLAVSIGIAGLGSFGIVSIMKIRAIMPVFKEYSYYAIPAIILLFLTALAEYFESIHLFSSDTQLLYIAHFLLYSALSILFIAFGKLKKPKGIYMEG